MERGTIPAVLLLAGLAAAQAATEGARQQAAPEGARQNDAPVFRAGVALVRVEALVTDGSRIINGLTKQDFVVHDNGRSQPVLYFSQENQPLDLLLLMDVSGSMRTSVEQVAAASRAALAQLRPGDRVGLMIFTSRARLLAPLSEDFTQIETALSAVLESRPRGGTNINGALYDAAMYLQKEPRSVRRRAVLIITDNVSPRRKSNKAVVRAFWEADAVLDGLITRSKLVTAVKWYSRIVFPPGMLLAADVTKIATETGGDTFDARDPGAGFQEAVERIRRRYTLHYAPPEGKRGEVRRVKVELSSAAKQQYPNAQVRARRAYVYTPSSSDIMPPALADRKEGR